MIQTGDPLSSGFLDRVYDAALEPELWSGVLETLAAMVGGEGVAMVFQNQHTGGGDGLFVGLDPAVKPLYFGRFRDRNVVMQQNRWRVGVKFQPRVITDQDVLPKRDLMRSEYYNDFLLPFGVHAVLMLGLAVRDTSAATVNIVRPPSRPDYDEAEIRTARALQPHLIRSFRLGMALAERSPFEDGAANLVERSSQGLLILDGSGQVRHANPAAETILALADGLDLTRGVLSAASPDATRALQALVAAAASPDPEQRRGGSIALARPSGAAPLLVTVTPARSPRLALYGGVPSVLVSVNDPGAAVDLPEQRLRQLFGLSPAEARVALQLLEGRDPRQAADELGLSFYTVRAHLVRIFEKTQTNRQAELVRLLMRATD